MRGGSGASERKDEETRSRGLFANLSKAGQTRKEETLLEKDGKESQGYGEKGQINPRGFVKLGKSSGHKRGVGKRSGFLEGKDVGNWSSG